ncbi:MAG: hypothetical protein ROR55_20090 [Devosia sp.]
MTDEQVNDIRNEVAHLREDFEKFAASRLERDKTTNTRIWQMILTFGIFVASGLIGAGAIQNQIGQHETAIVELQKQDDVHTDRSAQRETTIARDVATIRELLARLTAEKESDDRRLQRLESRIDRLLSLSSPQSSQRTP